MPTPAQIEAALDVIAKEYPELWKPGPDGSTAKFVRLKVTVEAALSAAEVAAWQTNPDIARLKEIEAAAMEWRKSLEDDGWSKDLIESDVGVCRTGISKLFKLLHLPDPPPHTGET